MQTSCWDVQFIQDAGPWSMHLFAPLEAFIVLLGAFPINIYVVENTKRPIFSLNALEGCYTFECSVVGEVWAQVLWFGIRDIGALLPLGTALESMQLLLGQFFPSKPQTRASTNQDLGKMLFLVDPDGRGGCWHDMHCHFISLTCWTKWK